MFSIKRRATWQKEADLAKAADLAAELVGDRENLKAVQCLSLLPRVFKARQIVIPNHRRQHQGSPEEHSRRQIERRTLNINRLTGNVSWEATRSSRCFLHSL